MPKQLQFRTEEKKVHNFRQKNKKHRKSAHKKHIYRRQPNTYK